MCRVTAKVSQRYIVDGAFAACAMAVDGQPEVPVAGEIVQQRAYDLARDDDLVHAVDLPPHRTRPVQHKDRVGAVLRSGDTGAEKRDQKRENTERRVTAVAVQPGGTVLDEVQEIIALPEYDSSIAKQRKDPETVELAENVTDQLRSFVSCVASMYRGNAFHNFEHASEYTHL